MIKEEFNILTLRFREVYHKVALIFWKKCIFFLFNNEDFLLTGLSFIVHWIPHVISESIVCIGIQLLMFVLNIDKEK